MPVYGHHFEGIRYDIGDRVDYLITQVEYALRRDDLRRRFEPYLKQRMRMLAKASQRRNRT
jgi:UTP--glucose-1-phosphate uridylyltransferase